MKRIIIVSILFLICLWISIFTVHYITEVTEFMNSNADAALMAIGDADEEKILHYVDNLSNFWGEEEDRLIHYIRHAQIDDITKSVARLQALATGEDYSELAAELASIKWQMEHIHRSETKFLANLLKS